MNRVCTVIGGRRGKSRLYWIKLLIIFFGFFFFKFKNLLILVPKTIKRL